MRGGFEPGRFRRRAAGVSLIAGPLVLLVGTTLHPPRERDEADMLARIAPHRDLWYAAHSLFLLSIVFAIPAILGLAHLVRARPGWAHLGGTLGLLGVVPVTVVVGLEFAVWQMAAFRADRTQMAELYSRLNDSPGIAVVLAGSLAFPLGFLVLGIALHLTRAAPLWTATLVAVAPAAFFAAGLAYSAKALTIVTAAAMLAGQGAVGLRVLTGPDEAWTPV
jgi:hypothetical protein